MPNFKPEEPALITIDLTGDDEVEDHQHHHQDPIVIKCRVCFDPPEEAVVTLCGHVYCYACLTKALEVCSSCPVCRQSSGFIRIYY